MGSVIPWMAVVGCYLAIITMYVWVGRQLVLMFREISEVKDMLNRHKNESDKHTPSTDLVFKDVCDIQVRHFKETVDELKNTIKEEFTEVKSLIREKQ